MAYAVAFGRAKALLRDLADLAERMADDEYLRIHGQDDLDTGHTRDPEGDEAAHG